MRGRQTLPKSFRRRSTIMESSSVPSLGLSANSCRRMASAAGVAPGAGCP